MEQLDYTIYLTEEEDGEIIYVTQIENEEVIDEICMDRETAIELALLILNTLVL